ncbi:MAG TPA: hypothetical protein VG940_11730 [Gemmatimonadales bacterium]|nr:hypothetical protein [Gemmatimonadales bacterium]
MVDRWKQADELSAHVKELSFAAQVREDREFIPFRKFLVGYLTGLFGTIGLTYFGHRLWGLNPYGTMLIVGGVVYLLAAGQRPLIVYHVLRQVRWFGRIHDPRRLRVIMLVLGLLLLLVGSYVLVDGVYPRG